jgi:hypothetical protein
MTRSAARRSGAVQSDKSTSPAVPASGPAAKDSPTSAPVSSGVPWFWRFVLFLWGTSFLFLLLYEWLAAILKSWAKS